MPDPTIVAVVLAAGMSSRFGANKLLVEVDGMPLVQRAFEAATIVCGDRVITVVGCDAASVLRAAAADSGFIVVNEDFAEGMGTSIAAAVRACPQDTAALLLLLADQPRVSPAHLNVLLERWSGDSNEIVATACGDVLSPPVLLPRATFADLSALSGDSGARALFRDARFRVSAVRSDDAAIDIDTPSDLAALT